MADYKHIAFDSEWVEKVSEYIEEHPEEGFEPGEEKQFIKYVVNRYMSGKDSGFTKEQIKSLVEELRLD